MLCRRRQRSCDYVSQRGLRIGFNIKSGSARSGERTKELEEEWLKTQKIEENKMSWSKSPQCTHTLRREQIRLAKINYRRTSVAITKKKKEKVGGNVVWEERGSGVNTRRCDGGAGDARERPRKLERERRRGRTAFIPDWGCQQLLLLSVFHGTHVLYFYICAPFLLRVIHFR